MTYREPAKPERKTVLELTAHATGRRGWTALLIVAGVITLYVVIAMWPVLAERGDGRLLYLVPGIASLGGGVTLWWRSRRSVRVVREGSRAFLSIAGRPELPLPVDLKGRMVVFDGGKAKGTSWLYLAVQPREGKRVLFVEGRGLIHRDEKNWPDDLTDTERFPKPDYMIRPYNLPALRKAIEEINAELG